MVYVAIHHIIAYKHGQDSAAAVAYAPGDICHDLEDSAIAELLAAGAIQACGKPEPEEMPEAEPDVVEGAQE